MSSAVDLALVLAVDCSSSVDEADFRLQMDGTAAALRNPALAEAIAGGPSGSIALALIQWSSPDSQNVTLAWRALSDSADLDAAARDIERAERQWRPGGTGFAVAIDVAASLLDTLPVATTRSVIDISGNGVDNEGGDVAQARNRAIAGGITINGLPIIDGSRLLEGYYREQVIGGPGAFLQPADTIMSFRDAMTKKLLREVTRQAIY
jgi:hypothetical protein